MLGSPLVIQQMRQVCNSVLYSEGRCNQGKIIFPASFFLVTSFISLQQFVYAVEIKGIMETITPQMLSHVWIGQSCAQLALQVCFPSLLHVKSCMGLINLKLITSLNSLLSIQTRGLTCDLMLPGAGYASVSHLQLISAKIHLQ